MSETKLTDRMWYGRLPDGSTATVFFHRDWNTWAAALRGRDELPGIAGNYTTGCTFEGLVESLKVEGYRERTEAPNENR